MLLKLQINRAEEAIKSTYKRIKDLEGKLQAGKLTEEKEITFQTELEEVRKLLSTYESQLAHLRTHNRSSFVFVVALFFIFFSLYALYILVFGIE